MPFNVKRDGSNPAIIFPHGGPTGQTVDSWSRWSYALATRGYIVLMPNPRGSTGYARGLRALSGGLHAHLEQAPNAESQDGCKDLTWKCCNFDNGDGGRPERNWAARSHAAKSNDLTLSPFFSNGEARVRVLLLTLQIFIRL
jgi:hypothetical protein